MSMPGFAYFFSCLECRTLSDHYPVYIFPDILDSHMHLPVWSSEKRCYGRLILNLPAEDRFHLEQNREARLALARRLSSPSVTVGMPQLGVAEKGKSWKVEVDPPPTCPFCGAPVEVRFGYPPRD